MPITRRTLADVSMLLSGKAPPEVVARYFDPNSDVSEYFQFKAAHSPSDDESTNALARLAAFAEESRNESVRLLDQPGGDPEELQASKSIPEMLAINEQLAHSAALQWGYQDKRTLGRHVLLAHTLVKVQRYEEAEAMADQVLELCDDSVENIGLIIEAQAVIASSCEVRNDLDRACALWSDLIRQAKAKWPVAPAIVRFLFALSRCESKRRNYDEALRHALAAYKGCPSLPQLLPIDHVELMFFIGLVRTYQGYPEQGLQTILMSWKAAQLQPPDLRLDLPFHAMVGGHVALQVGQSLIGERFFRESLARISGTSKRSLYIYSKCHAGLGFIYLSQDAPDEARRHYSASLQAMEHLSASRPADMAVALNNLAVVEHHAGQRGSCMTHLTHALDLLRQNYDETGRQMAEGVQGLIELLRTNLAELKSPNGKLELANVSLISIAQR